MRRRRPALDRGDREAQRGRLRVRATRWSTCTACRIRGSDDEAGGAPRAGAGDGPGGPDDRASTPTCEDFESGGGIVEERITGASPDQPERADAGAPDGSVELLSTHDQLLGGASGQSYLGCVFPADPAYAAAHRRACDGRRPSPGRTRRDRPVRRRLRDGAGRRAAAWTAYAIELNLRKGGTTHPFLTLQFLTDGHYDGATGRFVTAAGDVKHLVATDHFEDDRSASPHASTTSSTWWRPGACTSTRPGRPASVLHMMSCVTECGRLGLTAVGDSAEQAHADLRGGAARAARRGRAGPPRRAHDPVIRETRPACAERRMGRLAVRRWCGRGPPSTAPAAPA